MRVWGSKRRPTAVIADRREDARLETLPTPHGFVEPGVLVRPQIEVLLLRPLGQSCRDGDDELPGFPTPLAARIDAMANRPSAILLVTGPTGSGKTTTLHTNSAATSGTRLVDMGVEPFLLAALPNGVHLAAGGRA
ncbi:ATPase, T2SS/T4P/T4SS family [Aureimonas pseudogalii]|uniref:Type II secretory ATPase GspE/PulE/Tfp pilus assembly ATPase PilB-like protein n=1 Tax=Aureimonas pseudogalii TaxID=1744844 RepID=A0A7W6ED13_9HYPH|nr:ATPase, T2SS/T4P/T4SS family [Aureimonas pseudogalii]MBB3997047.1 type II secretory ATPase GspE/PulE/Tfp pilus assembly ATPase PilB-like protein [Aureimonas pseudogalii]